MISLARSKMSELEPIIKYKMDDMEAKAFKIAIIWQEECNRELPKESCVRLKRNSDPRKSTLFKYCYKLAKETKGILKDSELPLYVRAQLQILKSIREGEVHALIEPHCLVGEKAWKRWKIWKYKYQKAMNKIERLEEISTKAPKIIVELNKTMEFLEPRGCLSEDEFKSNLQSMTLWASLGQISYFYVVLSPWIKKFLPADHFEFDHVYYRSSITPQVEEHFRKKFAHEYL